MNPSTSGSSSLLRLPLEILSNILRNCDLGTLAAAVSTGKVLHNAENLSVSRDVFSNELGLYDLDVFAVVIRSLEMSIGLSSGRQTGPCPSDKVITEHSLQILLKGCDMQMRDKRVVTHPPCWPTSILPPRSLKNLQLRCKTVQRLEGHFARL
jgi:hypothetical protein